MSVGSVFLALALVLKPDYAGVTVPPNLAPLNADVIGLADGADCTVELAASDGDVLATKGPRARFDLGDWRRFLARHVGGAYEVRARTGGETHVFGTNVVSRHPIDTHLTYRLVAPAYVAYDRLGTWQRDLRDFSVRPLYRNKQTTQNQCVNCHVYRNGDPDTYAFLVRLNVAGTEIVSPKYGRRRCDLKVPGFGSSGSYCAWHPSGDWIAISVNETQQMFYTMRPRRLEVADLRGDLVVYSLARNEVRVVERAPEDFETYPAWSVDGRFLYTSRARTGLVDLDLENKPRRTTQVAMRLDRLHYDLVERAFDPATGTFGAPRTIVDGVADQVSVTHPRTTPDGRWLVAPVAAWGVFPIGQDESDLWIFDLRSGAARRLDEVNSPRAESYPSFGRSPYWMVFSSRRGDGLYTRFYLAAFDPETGRFAKPFLLPQRSPDVDDEVHFSYNVPEFSDGPLKLSPRELGELVRGPLHPAPTIR